MNEKRDRPSADSEPMEVPFDMHVWGGCFGHGQNRIRFRAVLAKYVFGKSVKCFYDLTVRQRHIHTDGIGSVEGSAVLPDNTYADSGAEQLVYVHLMGLAPFGAVKVKHVCTLGLGQLNTREMLQDKMISVIHIFRQSLSQFFQPLLSFIGIGADQSVHGKDVHVVIVT